MFEFKPEDLLPYASPEDIHKHCNHYDLFRHYIGEFTIGRAQLSPLRSENKASFAIYVKNNTVLFNDFAGIGGDIIKFVQLKFGLSYRGSINKIVHDSGLTNMFKSDMEYAVKPIIAYNKKIEYVKPTINVKRRKWAKCDVDFWSSFGITKETLLKYRVSPISHIFFNSKIVTAERFAYCFREVKDNISTFTIYQPFSKSNKWFKSHDASVFYGWSQLPDKEECLIITKSMKDVMTIDSITGIPAVALQSEKTKPKEHILQQLRDRFTNIYLLYDNDYENKDLDKPNYGREFGKSICTEFNITQIEIPDRLAVKYKAKDLSDLAKGGGRDYICNILEEPHKFII